VHTVLTERIEAALAQANLLSLDWYDVLWELVKAEGGKLRMHELAQRIVLSRSNLTRLADRLQNAELVTREDCPDDRRGYFLVSTEKGRQTRNIMWPIYQREIDTQFSKRDGQCVHRDSPSYTGLSRSAHSYMRNDRLSSKL
jgi:DNA-binding MarR family transcriptional regulator